MLPLLNYTPPIHICSNAALVHIHEVHTALRAIATAGGSGASRCWHRCCPCTDSDMCVAHEVAR